MTNHTQGFQRIIGSVGAVTLVTLCLSVSAAGAANGPDTVKLDRADAATRQAAPTRVRKAPTIFILSTSPATPVAGQPYTLVFHVTRLGVEVDFTDWGCLAMMDARPLPPGPQVKTGLTASCTWNIPATARGKRVDGIIAARVGTVSTFRGWGAVVQ